MRRSDQREAAPAFLLRGRRTCLLLWAGRCDDGALDVAVDYLDKSKNASLFGRDTYLGSGVGAAISFSTSWCSGCSGSCWPGA